MTPRGLLSALALFLALLIFALGAAPPGASTATLAATAPPRLPQQPPAGTLTPTPASLTVTGLVYDASRGPGAPIAGAHVAVTVCVPRSFHAVTGDDGHYTLFVPAAYVCVGMTIQAWADGYAITPSLPIAAGEVRRDFALSPATPTPTALPYRWFWPDVPHGLSPRMGPPP